MDEVPSIILEDTKLRLFLNGVNLKTDKINGVYKIYNEAKEFIGTGEIINSKLKRDVIL